MAKLLGSVVDEVRVVQIAIPSDVSRVIVDTALGTRNEDGVFVCATRKQYKFYAPGVQPVGEPEQDAGNIRSVPEHLLLGIRALLVAFEDYLQNEVGEKWTPLPGDLSELMLRAYDKVDPRVSVYWVANDGFNGRLIVPKPDERMKNDE